MTHRFDLQTSEQQTTILFQGLLDRAALAELEAHCQAHQRRGETVRVVLGAGTRVEANLLEQLVRIEGIALAAQSPFLSRWIETCRNGKGTR